MIASGSIVGIAAAAIVAGVSAIACAADDKDRQAGEVAPRRAIEERPFGGPPPRSLKLSKTCKTAKTTCELKNPTPVGATCSCAGGSKQGTEGKVE